MLSDYNEKIADKYRIKVGGIKKLLPNLGDKTNYVIHCSNLQLYLSLGMKLTKIHKILEFKQSDWRKNYIEFNTEKRKNAKNEFGKSFFKLMNSNGYGKTVENLRKRINVRLVNTAKDCLKYISKPTFISQKIFNKNFATIHEYKPILVLNKPIYIGFTVLELSKYLIYNLHYIFVNFVLHVKSNQKILMKNILKINTYLILVNINQNYLMQLTNKLLAKRKTNLKEFQ